MTRQADEALTEYERGVIAGVQEMAAVRPFKPTDLFGIDPDYVAARDYDGVTVTRHEDGSLTWTWTGDTGLALVRREVMESMLTEVSEHRARCEAARKDEHAKVAALAMEAMGGAYDSGWDYATRAALALIEGLLASATDESHALAYTTALETMRELTRPLAERQVRNPA